MIKDVRRILLILSEKDFNKANAQKIESGLRWEEFFMSFIKEPVEDRELQQFSE